MSEHSQHKIVPPAEEVSVPAGVEQVATRQSETGEIPNTKKNRQSEKISKAGGRGTVRFRHKDFAHGKHGFLAEELVKSTVMGMNAATTESKEKKERVAVRQRAFVRFAGDVIRADIMEIAETAAAIDLIKKLSTSSKRKIPLINKSLPNINIMNANITQYSTPPKNAQKPRSYLPTKDFLGRSPRDSAEARQLYSRHLFKVLEAQAELVAKSIWDGSYVRGPEAAIQKNNCLPVPSPETGEKCLPSVYYYMSRLLATLDGPQNVIWGEDGFAAGYRLPSGGGTFLGDQPDASILTHFCFNTIPDAWKAFGASKEGISLDRFWRILAHRWVGLIAPIEDGSGWKPGPANRRKKAHGMIDGFIDWVISDPQSGALYLTPHGMLLMSENIKRWELIIF